MCPGTDSIHNLPAVVVLDKTNDNESIDSAVLQETTSEYLEDGSCGENTESSEKPIPPFIEAQNQTNLFATDIQM